MSDGAPVLQLSKVSKQYRSGSDTLDVLREITLSVAEGEFITIVGPSGCGKSTLLSLIAGLEDPTSGTIALHGDVNARRLGRIGYMPQRDLLLPWRRALDNAGAGLEVQGVSRRDARRRARALFMDFGLDGFLDSYPSELSGGMRQRVAFARTVLVSRDLLLLDEPFGALDALTRAGLQKWLQEIWQRLRMACVFVTHDVDEALLLADQVYALSPRPGRIEASRTIPLERPRTESMLDTPELRSLKAELLEVLAGGAGTPTGRVP